MFSVPLNCASSPYRSMAHKPDLLVAFQRSYKFGTFFIGPLSAVAVPWCPASTASTWFSGSVRLSIEFFIWLNFSFPILQLDFFLRVLVILNCLSLLKNCDSVSSPDLQLPRCPRMTLNFWSSYLYPECLDYRCALSHLAYTTPQPQPKALCWWLRTSSTELYLQPLHHS